MQEAKFLTLSDVQSRAWQESAACRDKGHHIFFFEEDYPVNSKAFESAKRRATEMCLGCPVRLECFLWSVAERHEGGMYGGVRSNERHRDKRVPKKKIDAALREGAYFRFVSRVSVHIEPAERQECA